MNVRLNTHGDQTGCAPLSMWRSELPNSLTPQLPNSLTPQLRKSEIFAKKPSQKFRISGVEELRS